MTQSSKLYSFQFWIQKNDMRVNVSLFEASVCVCVLVCVCIEGVRTTGLTIEHVAGCAWLNHIAFRLLLKYLPIKY